MGLEEFIFIFKVFEFKRNEFVCCCEGIFGWGCVVLGDILLIKLVFGKYIGRVLLVFSCFNLYEVLI